MPASLSVTPDAQADTDDAGDYYESQRSGLGASFAAAVADCLRAICASPTR